MIIDHLKVETSLLDNENSIVRKIAYDRLTHPEYLIFEKEDEEDDEDKKKYITKNLIEDIRNSKKNISEFWNDIRNPEYIDKKNFEIPVEEFSQLWWIFNFRKGKVIIRNKIVEIKYILEPPSNIKNDRSYKLSIQPDPYELNIFSNFLDENNINTDTLISSIDPEYRLSIYNLDSILDKSELNEVFENGFLTLQDIIDDFKDFKKIIDDKELLKEVLEYCKKSLKTVKKSSVKSAVETIEDKINKFRSKQIEDIKYIEKFDGLKILPSTESSVINIIHEVSFDVEYDIYELFNNLKMSRDVPFAYIGDYYKILKEFIPTSKWISMDSTRKNSNDNILYLRVLNVKTEPDKHNISNKDLKKQETPSDYNLYSTIKISFESFYDSEKKWRLKQKEIDQRSKKQELLNQKLKIMKEKKINYSMKDEVEINKKIQELDDESMKKVEEEMNAKKYTGKSRVYILIQSVINQDFTVKDLTNRIFEAFPNSPRENLKIKEVNLKVQFNIPNFILKRSIFTDMSMNDYILSKLIIIDEREKIGKEKGGLKFDLQTSLSENRPVYCDISEKIVNKKDKLIGKLSGFEEGNEYLRVKINNIENSKKIIIYQKIFTKLLNHYTKRENAVIKEYKKYNLFDVDDYLKKERDVIISKIKTSSRERNMLKDISWNVYISGFARQCDKKAVPITLGKQVDPNIKNEPEEVKKLRQKDPKRSIILFPKNKNEDPDGIQRWYTCQDDSEYKYMGLRENVLANSNIYPAIPCCYKVDHAKKETSLYYKYYIAKKKVDGKKVEYTMEDLKVKSNSTRDSSHIILSKKMLFDTTRLAHLGRYVETFLNSASGIGTNITYLRKGIKESMNSAIDACNIALNKNKDKKLKDSSWIRKDMIRFLEENKSNVSQEAYLYTPETIKNYLANENKYFDPKLFYRLLEDYFDCYIYIFYQSDKFPDGTLACPYYIREYLQREKNIEDSRYREHKRYLTKNKKVVLLYEHYGADTNRTLHPYPHCELIVKFDNDEFQTKIDHDTVEDFYTSNMILVQNLETTFQEMYVNRIDKTNVFPIKLPFINTIKSQGIDYYGKTRYLQFENDICILTDPLPPYNYSEKYVYKPIDYDYILDFLNSEKIENYNHVNIGEITVGIKASKTGINFYIPVIPFQNTENIENNIISPSNIHDKSYIDLYNELNRKARYMEEYLLYLFSIFYKKDPVSVDDIDSKYLLEFMSSNVEIDPEYKSSDKILRTFSLDSSILRKNKLIVPNEIVYKKLLYVIRLNLRRRFNETIFYSNHKYIQNYFTDITDFEQKNNQFIILYGKNSLDSWINKKSLDYSLSDRIRPSNIHLYSELLKYPTDNIYMLMFYTKYCKTCKYVQDRIYSKSKRGFVNKNNTILSDPVILKNANILYIDVDENPGLKSMYNISTIPSFVFLHIKNDQIINLESMVFENENQNQIVKGITSKLHELIEKKKDSTI